MQIISTNSFPDDSLTDLVAKRFTAKQILNAYRECSAYRALKPLQGYALPLCYGVYHGDAHDEIFVILEKVSGHTMESALEAHPDDGKARELRVQATSVLAAIHQAGYAHGDINPRNFMLLEGGSMVVVDLENSRYVYIRVATCTI